jgi:diphthine-ammonia ligase
MWQTVAHDAVAAQASCLGLPLLRVDTAGAARTTDVHYGTAALPGDEVEDLGVALRAARARWPSLEAVAVGAVLSSYQRTRVEAQCHRLGLVPLAFLWQRAQSGLLREMVAAGVRAMLVKTAALGLGRRHVGADIADLVEALIDLVRADARRSWLRGGARHVCACRVCASRRATQQA